MVALNYSLTEINSQALFDHCNTKNDDLNENNEFAELLTHSATTVQHPLPQKGPDSG